MTDEQILGELAAGVAVSPDIRVEEPLPKLLDCRIRVIRSFGPFGAHQRQSGLKHRLVSKLIGLGVVAAVEVQLASNTSRSAAASANCATETTSPAHSPTPMSPIVYSRGSPQSE